MAKDKIGELILEAGMVFCAREFASKIDKDVEDGKKLDPREVQKGANSIVADLEKLAESVEKVRKKLAGVPEWASMIQTDSQEALDLLEERAQRSISRDAPGAKRKQDEIIRAIKIERTHQDQKWGPLERQNERNPYAWVSALEGQVESVDAALIAQEEPRLFLEAVQVAALLLAFLEQLGPDGLDTLLCEHRGLTKAVEDP